MKAEAEETLPEIEDLVENIKGFENNRDPGMGVIHPEMMQHAEYVRF